MAGYCPAFPAPYESDTLTVYYIEGCPYCNKTRKTLQNFKYNDKPLKYVLFDIDELCNNNRKDFWNRIDPYLKNKYFSNGNSKHSTFPVVFLKGKLIGGNSELQTILSKLN